MVLRPKYECPLPTHKTKRAADSEKHLMLPRHYMVGVLTRESERSKDL